MPTTQHSKYVKCPYYMYDDARTVICEGMYVNTKIINKWSQPSEPKAHEAKQDHMRKYCQNKYEECMVCAMLNQKYE